MYCRACFDNWKEIVPVKPFLKSVDGIMFYKCDVCFSISPNPLKEDFMAKNEPVKSKPTVWESKAVVCQCCRSHSNKPSTCSEFGKSVGRKQDATKCDEFNRKK